jgi:hypothetical protein
MLPNQGLGYSGGAVLRENTQSSKNSFRRFEMKVLSISGSSIRRRKTVRTIDSVSAMTSLVRPLMANPVKSSCPQVRPMVSAFSAASAQDAFFSVETSDRLRGL